MRADAFIITLFFAAVVAALLFTVLFFVIRGAITEGMKRHVRWIAETQRASGGVSDAQPGA